MKVEGIKYISEDKVKYLLLWAYNDGAFDNEQRCGEFDEDKYLNL